MLLLPYDYQIKCLEQMRTILEPPTMIKSYIIPKGGDIQHVI